jgi:hypothetical protein
MTPLNAPRPESTLSHTPTMPIAALISLKRLNHPAGWKVLPNRQIILFTSSILTSLIYISVNIESENIASSLPQYSSTSIPIFYNP